MKGPSPVAICAVLHNSAADMRPFLKSVETLGLQPAEVILVDCASSDHSLEEAKSVQLSAPIRIVPLEENLGFAGGMNIAIKESNAPYVLALNPDVRPSSTFVGCMLQRFTSADHLKFGAVTGRLLRLDDSDPQLIDAAGMRLTKSWRHLDRGSSEADGGQYSEPERVFGATGAATLFSRRALEDVAIDGQFFLEEFHSFREDAELCFRLRERGWEILYEPRAQAHHRRTNLPERRHLMTAAVNYHSLKNRYLLRIYHQTLSNFFLTAIPTAARDLGILAYVLARERSSLAAYRWLWANRHALLARRRAIQNRRLRPPRDLNAWFFRSARLL